MFDEASYFIDLLYELKFNREIVFDNYAFYNGFAGNYELSIKYADKNRTGCSVN